MLGAPSGVALHEAVVLVADNQTESYAAADARHAAHPPLVVELAQPIAEAGAARPVGHGSGGAVERVVGIA